MLYQIAYYLLEKSLLIFFVCLAIHDDRRVCVFLSIWYISDVTDWNSILLEKLGAEGKWVSRSACKGVYVYICVCIYMYIHVCIKRSKSHGMRGTQIQGRCKWLLATMFSFGSPFFSIITFLVVFYLFIEMNVCCISHKCYQIFPVAGELLNYLRNIMYNLISLTLSTIFISFIEIIIPPYPSKG